MRHTPGPWTQGNAYNAGQGYAICAGPIVVARINGGGYPTGLGRAPESDANARLIAAAPLGYDLALKIDVARRKDWEGVDLDELNDLAQEFLAKATGEA